ncbi:MAG: hypothetical protein R3A44_33980 [Caldilineaceae bacterium]
MRWRASGMGGHTDGPQYLWFRVPLQLLFIAWTWYFTLRPNHHQQQTANSANLMQKMSA